MRERSWLWVLGLALLPLAGFWSHGLFDLDEGFYGSIAAEMNRRGEWITPSLNGQPWFEKPILIYWLAKPFMLIFGADIGARLPSVLAALVTVAGVFQFAKSRWGEGAAVWSALILASSLLWAALGRLMMTDTLLVAAWFGAVLLFWEGISRPNGVRFGLMAGLALGASVLAKGPVGVLLFVPIAAYGAWLLRPGIRPWGTLTFFTGLVAAIASWYGPAYFIHRQLFVQKFLIEQNLNRFQGGDLAHTISGPLNYFFFVPILLLGFAPWSFSLPRAWPRAEAEPTLKYLAAAALIPFLFFTLSSAKLVHYILPCFPPLALVVGDAFREKTNLMPAWVTLGVVSLLTNLGLPIYYQSSGHAEVHQLARSLAPGEPVVVYQMPRRQADRGTGRPKLQETSHPSLGMYLNRETLEAEEIRGTAEGLQIRARPDDPWRNVATPAWILTRSDRIPNPEGYLSQGLRLTPRVGENYAAYRVERVQ